MIQNPPIMDRFADDRVDFASIAVSFASFKDGERRFRERDRGESDSVIVKSVRFRQVEERNRHGSVPSPPKSVIDRSKTARFLVEIVAFMSKTVPLRSVMDLFLRESARYFRR